MPDSNIGCPRRKNCWFPACLECSVGCIHPSYQQLERRLGFKSNLSVLIKGFSQRVIIFMAKKGYYLVAFFMTMLINNWDDIFYSFLSDILVFSVLFLKSETSHWSFILMCHLNLICIFIGILNFYLNMYPFNSKQYE
jgi:hypothetical protein